MSAHDLTISVADDVNLHVRHTPGAGRPLILVHGLASNCRLWEDCATTLALGGHEVAAVDLRGHGESDAPETGYTTEQAARDVEAVAVKLGMTGERAPIIVGQSWGAAVVLTAAATGAPVAGVALIDGGWQGLGEVFATFDDCWDVLAPPIFTAVPYEEMRRRFEGWMPGWPPNAIAGALANFRELPDGTAQIRLTRDRHKQILRSLYEYQPTALYGKVTVPVLLAPAVDVPPTERSDRTRRAVEDAAEALADARISWYEGAHHDLHSQHPHRLAADLMTLAADV